MPISKHSETISYESWQSKNATRKVNRQTVDYLNTTNDSTETEIRKTRAVLKRICPVLVKAVSNNETVSSIVQDDAEDKSKTRDTLPKRSKKIGRKRLMFSTAIQPSLSSIAISNDSKKSGKHSWMIWESARPQFFSAIDLLNKACQSGICSSTRKNCSACNKQENARTASQAIPCRRGSQVAWNRSSRK